MASGEVGGSVGFAGAVGLTVGAGAAGGGSGVEVT